MASVPDDNLYQASMIHTDVAIIGAGPVGLFAAFECGMLKLDTVLIDALDEVGGQCAALYPEKPIFDIPAHPAIAAGALIGQLEAQIAPFAPPRLLGRTVVALQGEPGAFILRTDKGDTVGARAVLIAAGAGAFGPNRPPLDNLAAYEATGAVQYYVRRRQDFRGRTVVIGGGGDSAVGLGAAAEGRRRQSVRGAPPRQVPRRPGDRSPAGRGGRARRGGDGDPLPAARLARHRWQPEAPSKWRISTAPRATSKPTACCRSSASRWTWARSPTGGWVWS